MSTVAVWRKEACIRVVAQGMNVSMGRRMTYLPVIDLLCIHRNFDVDLDLMITTDLLVRSCLHLHYAIFSFNSKLMMSDMRWHVLIREKIKQATQGVVKVQNVSR